MPITFEIVHTCLSIRNSYAHVVSAILFFHICDHLGVLYMTHIFDVVSFMPITSEIVHTCLSINNASTYKVLCESQLFWILTDTFVQFKI